MLIAIALMCLMGMRHRGCWDEYNRNSIGKVFTEIDEPTILVGVVDQAVQLRRDPIDSLPARRPRNGAKPNDTGSYETILTLAVETVRRGSQNVPMTGRVRVRASGDASYLRPGDRIRVYGKISTMDRTSNPGERDMTEWMIRKGLHATVKVERGTELEQLESPSWQTPQRWLHRKIADLAASARQGILQYIAPEQHGIALALILGQRDLLEHTTSESLVATGTAHLLSVSGLHLGILFVVARLIAGWLRLPMGAQLIFLGTVTVFYVAITGGRPPVLRAAILLSTIMLSMALARSQQPLNSLSLALLLLAGAMPLEVFAVGMQLSFLAVATLLSCGPQSRRQRNATNHAVELEENFDALAQKSSGRTQRVAKRFLTAVRTALWYSGCVTMTTLPLVWHAFHVVSPISVLVNVILSPMMVVALSAGVATVLAGWCWGPLGAVPGWICSVMLSLMRDVIEIARSIPGGHFWLPSPPLFWIVAYYLVLVILLAVRPRGQRRWPIGIWSFVWIVSAWWISTTPASLPRDTLEATFIDVGHGTAAILRSERDEVWLYDCGWLGNFKHRSHKIDEVLWSMGITRIDGVILSHADADHFNALPGLATRFSIKQLVTPPGMLEGGGRSLEIARQAIQRWEVPVIEVDHDDPLPDELGSDELGSDELGSGIWTDTKILHPPRVPVAGSDNANSLVLQINHGGRFLLLPGDLEPPGTGVLTSLPRPPPGGVMMAPHHGSLHMDADAVLQWARPIETVVSGGKRAAAPQVTEMLAVAGGGVHVTSRVGCIRVRIGPSGKIQIRAWKTDPW
ncbi:ComEC/Rec2 family competence protein [Neorhodopirellula lusitana]|uniref:ComEC/Rec2 family competence protein n=1 Tax=Neorhodopirellula lusitana TaxID=445327 RepID=UPI00385179DE